MDPVPGFPAVPEGCGRPSCFLISGTPNAVLDSFALEPLQRVLRATQAALHYQALGNIVQLADIARSGAFIGRFGTGALVLPPRKVTYEWNGPRDCLSCRGRWDDKHLPTLGVGVPEAISR